MPVDARTKLGRTIFATNASVEPLLVAELKIPLLVSPAIIPLPSDPILIELTLVA